MSNRDFLSGIFDHNGNYANDTLQGILSKLYKFDNYDFANLLQKQMDNEISDDELIKLNDLSFSCDLMIKSFNRIVENNDVNLILKFIKQNY